VTSLTGTPHGYFAKHLQHEAVNLYKHASILSKEFVLESGRYILQGAGCRVQVAG